MKKQLIVLLAATFLAGCYNPLAPSTKTPEQIKAQLIKAIPELNKIDEINKSPVNGMYEVIVGRKVFYVSSDGKYLFFGNIIDPVNKENLTQDRSNELNKIDWKQLPLDLAIKHVNGNGERMIAVFADPDCPYCQLFEKQVIPELTNTTIYTFLFPLPMHPNAKSDSAKIWCSNNREKTWEDWMRNKIALPDNQNCDTSDLDKIYKIGTDIVQVEGTPTLILSNGQILPGMIPADQLLVQIDKARGVTTKDDSSKAR